MQTDERKAAVGAYRERKVEAGIYAIRCAASDQLWVGAAPDLATIRNRLWFTLRQGRNPHASLQAAWTLHRAEAFGFEILEHLGDEEIDHVRNGMLKTRLQFWVDRLQAVRI